MHGNQVNSDLSATLDTVQELILPFAEIDAAKKQRIFNELDRARDQLQVLTDLCVSS